VPEAAGAEAQPDAPPLDARSVPRPSDAAAHRDVDGEVLVLDLEHAVLRGLNPTGSFLWRHMDGRRSVAELARELASHSGEPEERVIEDTIAFLTRMRALGLVDLVDTP
jgi:hypothetical protein